MANTYGRLYPTLTQVPPVVGELEAIFKALPDEELLTKLRGPRRRGPKGYDPKVLWRCYVALYYLGLPSVSDLVRTLQDNPFIAAACGIDSSDAIPSQPTFSRFFARLSTFWNALAVKNMLRSFTRLFLDTLPEFGRTVAIDSTDIKAWSNGGKNYGASDRDAGWIVKQATDGKRKSRWGYKVHILADCRYELPIAIAVTRGNFADVKKAKALLRQGTFTDGRFRPKHVICDAAYSSYDLRRAIRNYGAKPIIDPNAQHKKAVALTIRDDAWKALMRQRTAIERVNSRLKLHRRLDSVRVRGKAKVWLHAMLSVVVLQAQAVATESRVSVRRVA